MLLKPNLFFDGRAEEAINFYQKVFAVKAKNVVRYGDYPKRPGAEPMSEDTAKRIANARLNFGSTFFNVCDVLPHEKLQAGNNIRIDAVFTQDETHIEKVFTALSEGGNITKPFGKVFFSPGYGELTDRFGIKWALMVM